eukprot:7003234-Pyramimonas_sp.AAC.1
MALFKGRRLTPHVQCCIVRLCQKLRAKRRVNMFCHIICRKLYRLVQPQEGNLLPTAPVQADAARGGAWEGRAPVSGVLLRRRVP